jgi:HEAT repeat protein
LRFLALASLVGLRVFAYVSAGYAEGDNAKQLIDVLQNSDDEILRERAAEALGKIKDSRAIEVLIAVALKDRDSVLRQRAAIALSEIDTHRATEAFIDALVAENSAVRANAADALVAIGAPAVEPLISSLKSSNSNMRWHAADVLDRIQDARAVEPLIIALMDANSNVRESAALALRHSNDPRAIEPLIIAMKDSDPLVRGAAISGLGYIGRPAVKPLIEAMKTSTPVLREGAVEALGKIKDPQAVDALIVVLKDPDSVLQKRAAFALLNHLDDRRAVEALIGRGEDGTAQGLALALRTSGDRDMAALLLNSGNPMLEKAARDWANLHGYLITGTSDGRIVQWGGDR